MKHDECELRCTVCERPKDNYGHIHLQEDSLALCLPCIAMLARATRQARRAYDNGGSYFDRYGQERMNKLMQDGRASMGMGDGMPMPEGLARQLQELFDNMPGMQEED